MTRLVRPFLLLLVVLVGFAPNRLHGAVERLLGSHHMLALPWAGGDSSLTALFDEEVLRWKEQGYDFVVLHMDGYGAHYPQTLRAYYDSCARIGIKAMASWAWFTESDAPVWIPQIVRDTKDHPAQFKIDGLPVYCAFNLPPYTQQILQNAGLWPVKIWAQSGYYVPNVGQVHWWKDPIAITNTYATLPWLDGLCNFSGNMTADEVTYLNTMLVQQSRGLGKLSMAGVTPFYSSAIVREMHGFRGLETQWRGILQTPPNAVWWVTGNDWVEQSYVQDLPETPFWHPPWIEPGFPPILDHSGYRKFSEPFIAAYKSGQTSPTFSNDRLFLVYQLHPKMAPPIAGSPVNFYGGRPWRELLDDRISVGAHLTAPAQLRINGALSETFPAGVAHFDIPLNVGSAPDVAIVRNGSTVKSGTGPLPITNDISIGAWNYLAIEVGGEQPSPSSPPPVADAPPPQNPVNSGAFAAGDIGSPAQGGSTSFDSSSGQYSIRGSGRDIWENSDQFQFASQSVSGDATLIVHVLSVDYTDYWAKAGLMFRASRAADAQHVSVYVSPGAGVSMQWRDQTGGSSSFTNPIGVTAPRWLKLVRSGNTFTASYSSDGSTWVAINSHDVSLPANALGGLAVTSHNGNLVASAGFDSFSLLATANNTPVVEAPPPPPAPSGGGDSSVADIGSPALAGSTSFDASSGTYSIRGSGRDIWETSDQFQFSSSQVAGDTTQIVRVTSIDFTDYWAKAGLMFRASSAANAQHVSVFVSPGAGVSMQWRAQTGGHSSFTSPLGLTVPRWLKLVRAGDTFTASYSSDGSSWQQVSSVSLGLPSTTLAGLAVTSHNESLVAGATFDNYSVTTGGAAPQSPPSNSSSGGQFTGLDIGSPGFGGSTVFDAASGTYTIRGAGRDIWDGSDQFQFASAANSGNATLTARVTDLGYTDEWAKAGLMIRGSLDSNAQHVSVYYSPGRGISMQWRSQTGGNSDFTFPISLPAPNWLKLERSGDTFTASYSANGSSWQVIHSFALGLPANTFAGLAVTSHNAGLITTAKFDAVSVE